MVASRAHSVMDRTRRRNRDAAGCMVIAGSHFLLLQRSKSSHTEPLTWGIPGGRIDAGESPYEAALRETREEANVDLTSYYFVERFTQPLQNENGYFTTFVFSLPEVPNWDIKIDYESEDWGWFTLKQMESINLHPGMYYAMAKLGM